MIRSVRLSLLLVFAGAGVAGNLSAQSAPAPRPDTLVARDSVVATLAPAQSGGPRLDAARVGVTTTAAPELEAQRQPKSMGQPMALMIVGGAAIVLGAVIGSDIGTLFMIGGAGALLYGLYQYLK